MATKRRSRYTETTIVKVEDDKPPVEFKLVSVPVETSFEKITRLSPSRVPVRLQTPEKIELPRFELFTQEEERQIDKLLQDLELRILRADFDEKYGVKVTDVEFDHIRSIFGIKESAFVRVVTVDVEDTIPIEAVAIPDDLLPPKKRFRRQRDPLISGLLTLTPSLNNNESLSDFPN